MNKLLRMIVHEPVVCMEEGCQEEGENLVKCRMTIYKNDLYKPSSLWLIKEYGWREGFRNIIELWRDGYTDTYDFYCANHCQKNGFCYGCGEFWAGSESFDFSRSGLCSNCQIEVEDDYINEDDYYYSGPDDEPPF